MLAAALAVSCVTAACTANSSNPTPAALPGATPGGTLVVGSTMPGTVDPSTAYEPAGDQILEAVCEPLLSFDPLTAKPAAGMTASLVITNSGGLISIRLRSGVHFQNGSTLISTDVRDELSRVANQSNASYDAAFLSDVKGYDFIHGDVDTNNGAALRDLTGVNTISNDAFSISLTDDDADLVDLLGAPFAAPVPRKLSDGDPTSLATRPVCAGPYEMTRPWQAGQADIIVTRFPGYYARNPSYPRGGVGYADRIDFRIFASEADELAAFDAGQIDIASVPDGETAAAAAHGQVISAANGYVEYLGLPNGTGGSVFSQPAVHVALSQALDRQALGEVAYAGGTVPATGFFPPTVGSVYQPDACGATTPAEADPAAAQATLAKAGISLVGQSLKLYYNAQFQNRALADGIAAQWERTLGLKVVLMPEAWSDYLAHGTGAGGFDGAFLESWESPYPSADGYLYPLFDSASVGEDNFARYIDPTFDHDLEKVAREATTDSSRALAYRHLAAGLCQQLPMVPLLDRQWHYVVRPSQVGAAVGSFTDAASGLLDLREIYVK